jgi:hypothetical protein
MRRIFAKIFWNELDYHPWQAAICCLVLTVLWMVLSIGLYYSEGSGSYFEIKAILIFKILLTALIFGARYLLFTQYRWSRWLGWLFGITFLIALGGQGVYVVKAGFHWSYVLLKIFDAAAWGLFIAMLLEPLLALFRHWYYLKKIDIWQSGQLWKSVWLEIIRLGVLMTLLAGLSYYYLTSFYLLDTLFYSYLLLVPLFSAGIGLYIIIQCKVNCWLRQELYQLDQEIGGYIQWQCYKDEADLNSQLISLEYLTLIRNYIAEISRPRFPWKAGGIYLLFIGFILALPYIFGFAVEVSSFK